MKKWIRIIAYFLCMICLFCACNFEGGVKYPPLNSMSIRNWTMQGGDTITGITPIDSNPDALAIAFEKSQDEENGMLVAEIGLSVKENAYVNFMFSAATTLCVGVSCVLLNPSNATDTLTLEGTILTQTTDNAYTLILNNLQTEYTVLKSVSICPSYGTEAGNGVLYMKKAEVSKYCDGTATVVALEAVTPPDDSSSSSLPEDSSGEIVENPTYLWEKYNTYFPIGYASGVGHIDRYKGTLDKHFNSFTCENEMKMYTIAPNSLTQDNFGPADNMLNYVISQGKRVRGHALVWYSGAPNWITSCRDKQTLLSYIEQYVTRVMQHFGDKVYCWDVVNEAVGDDNQYRSTFYDVAGIDFIKTAFRTARRVNPNIKLFYNDYNMDKPQKRAKVMEMLRELIADGVPIDGVGMQGHYDLKYTTVSGVEAAIRDFSSLGLEVQITELDIKNYGNSGATKQAQLYGDLFALFRRYANVITGVTLWNVADDYSWLDGDSFSHFGTGKAYPTLFDENHNKKQAFYNVFNF